jgi:23S rRNA (uracil1939-C5)-methyltransferase
VDIAQLSPAGDGTARMGTGTCEVPFTIPGERVRIRLTGPRTAPRATLVEVVRPSPHRVDPRCRHFGPSATGAACGGCAWQHIAYPEQLRLKRALLDRLIRSVVPDAPPAAPTLAPAGEPWGFRQKVHFVFADGGRGGRLRMGHYARGGRRVLAVDDCPVHDPRGNRLAEAFHRRLASAGIQAEGDERTGSLKALAVRVSRGTDDIAATLVVRDDRDRRLRTATRAVMAATPNTAFHLNLHPRRDGFVFGAETRTLGGSPRLREQVGDCTYLISPTSFFQTNVGAAELLVAEVMRAMPPAPATVLDLHAGAGLFSIPLARAGYVVTAVESNRDAVSDGIASARLNRVSQEACRFIVSRAENGLRSGRRADAAIIDPPREGCTPELIERLFGEVRPRTVAYVSCSPEALARDLGAILPHGYRVVSVTPVDMFPHTAHIESVTVLTR